MYKNATYKDKFADLHDWVPFIVGEIKSDLCREHLKKDLNFVRRFLASKNIPKVTTEELAKAYQKAIKEEPNGESLAEFITSRWLLQHSEVYDFFEEELKKINPEFTELEELEEPVAESLINRAIAEFGAPNAYIFSVLNSVVFPNSSFDSLKKQATHHQQNKEKIEEETSKQLSAEAQIARITNKYEKKIAGLQKKYSIDVENLKKQIGLLQRKMQEKQ